MPNRRRVYRTRLFDSTGYSSFKPPYKGRFWQGDLRILSVEEGAYFRAIPDLPKNVRRYNPPRSFVATKEAKSPEWCPRSTEAMERSRRRMQFAPEILIRASDRLTAQRAANLILAAASIEQGYPLLEQLLALPEPGEPYEDLDELEYESAVESLLIKDGMALSCAIAAKASQRRRWVNALTSQFASLRAFSVHYMETHPKYGTAFGIEKDPVRHPFFAQAILSSYMAIEALGLEVRASSKVPSKLPDGQWNPTVLRDLEERLNSAGINLGEEFVWTTRNSPTRIERKHGAPKGAVPSWAGGRVRDRLISVTDALSRASFVRSKAAAHGGSKYLRSVTVYDVDNAQNLARRLFLESLGFWRCD